MAKEAAGERWGIKNFVSLSFTEKGVIAISIRHRGSRHDWIISEHNSVFSPKFSENCIFRSAGKRHMTCVSHIFSYVTFKSDELHELTYTTMITAPTCLICSVFPAVVPCVCTGSKSSACRDSTNKNASKPWRDGGILTFYVGLWGLEASADPNKLLCFKLGVFVCVSLGV